MNRAVVLVVVLVLLLLASCTSSRLPTPVVADTAAHDVYVWRRTITDDVRAEMRAAANTVSRFKVLAREHEHQGHANERREVWVDWQARDFPAREVTLVWRIGDEVDNSVDNTLDIAPLLVRAQALRAGGVNVTAIEIDHDCPTRALRDYAAWLARTRVATTSSGLRLTITALPTWASDSGALQELAAVVDGLTVQVHMVKAPVIFDVDDAARDFNRFVAAVPPAVLPVLRVALPTYRATLADGVGVSVTRAEVQRFLAQHPWPRVSWFRLGAVDDSDAWGAATLASVVAHEHAEAAATVRLHPTSTALVFDVVVDNAGTVDVDAPARITLVNANSADGLQNYRALHDDTWRLQRRDPPRLRPGTSVVVGWVRGSGVVVAP